MWLILCGCEFLVLLLFKKKKMKWKIDFFSQNWSPPLFSFLSLFFFLSFFFSGSALSLPFSVAAPITNNRRLLPAAALLCFFFFLSLAQQKQAAADRAATEADWGAWTRRSSPVSGDFRRRTSSLKLEHFESLSNSFEFHVNQLLFSWFRLDVLGFKC